jgi:hypothetical protein
VDYSAVMTGSAVEIKDDVIVVPISTTKYIIKRFVGSLVDGISIGSFAGS